MNMYVSSAVRASADLALQGGFPKTYFWIRQFLLALFGATLLGRYIDSPAYELVKEWIAVTPVLRYVVNAESMLITALISSVGVMSAAWAAILWSYSRSPDQDNYSSDFLHRVASVFLSAPGGLIAGWGSILVGTSLFGWVRHGLGAVSALLALSIFVFSLGLVFKAMTKPGLTDRAWLRQHARKLCGLCAAIAIAGLVYSFASGPLTWLLAFYSEFIHFYQH